MESLQQKVIIVVLSIVFLSGCAAVLEPATKTVQEIRDPRATVVLGTLNGRLGGGDSGSAEFCKFHSSEKLPNCIEYEYDDKRGCKFTVKTPCPDEGVSP